MRKNEKSNQMILGTTIISINKKKQTNPALTNKSNFKKDLHITIFHFTAAHCHLFSS